MCTTRSGDQTNTRHWRRLMSGLVMYDGAQPKDRWIAG
jgi:hypothetical protein